MKAQKAKMEGNESPKGENGEKLQNGFAAGAVKSHLKTLTKWTFFRYFLSQNLKE